MHAKHQFEIDINGNRANDLMEEYIELLRESMRLYTRGKHRLPVEDYFNGEIDVIERMTGMTWQEFIQDYGGEYGFFDVLIDE